MPVYDKASLELLGIEADPPSGVPNNSAPEGFFRGPSGAETAIAGDAYEGASRVSRELAAYSPLIRSANLDLRSAKKSADSRSRDLGRNDAFLQGGATIRKDNIVGSYFMLNAKPNSMRLFGKEDDTWESDFQEEVEEMFAAEAESYDAWLDAAGRNTLTAMTRMAVDQHTVTGEVLATVEWLRDPMRPFKTAIQMIDTDRLSNPMDKPVIWNDPSRFMGVEMNTYGAPVGYHIRMAHPSEFGDANAMKWKYVPMRKPWGRLQVIHIFEQLRPAQARGIGTMVAAIPEMKMARQFREIVLQNAILNATYAATVESELPAEAIFARLGGGGGDFTAAEVESALAGYMGGHYATLSSLMGGSKNLQIDGVKIPHLPPGTKLNLNGAGQGGPLGTEFETSLNRIQAAALGVSYEQFSRDFTQTNYSGFKGAMSETYKTMISIKRAVADRFASTVYRLWFEEAFNNGRFTTVKRRMPSLYDGMNMEYYTNCDWVGASRGQIDELKETQAAVLRINNGLSTREQELARLGQDWRKVMRQMKREKEWAEFYDILQNPTDTTSQENAANPSDGKARKAKQAFAPSVGNADALFTDSEYTDEAEEVKNE